ncbi:MAG: DNA gyrase inhibitor YacG [Stellaceae bacterium]
MSNLSKPSPCPICGKPATEHHKPFCSQRCATIDLARWITGTYRVPTDEVPEDVPLRGEEHEED